MSRITVATVIGAPPDVVWAYVADVASHVEWMHDAEAIHFRSTGRRGIGTVFDCETRVGPVRLTDKMTVTDWEEARELGIRHEGVVSGSGRFILEADGPGATRFTWTERLAFPWWMGGPAGAAVGAQILERVWKRNLADLASRFGDRPAGPGAGG